MDSQINVREYYSIISKLTKGFHQLKMGRLLEIFFH